MYELRSPAKRLLDILNVARRYRLRRPVANLEAVKMQANYWGDTPTEIESYFRQVCNPPDRTFDIPQAAEKLHLSEAKVRALIKEQKIVYRHGAIPAASISEYQSRSKPHAMMQKREVLS